MRTTWIVILALVIHAAGGDRAYVTAKLSKVDVSDMSIGLDLPPTTQNAPALVLPIPLGVIYQFTIEADGITYLAACTSKAKKSYAAEWVVNDPVQFWIEKNKLFLNRPNGKALRLGLVTKVRSTRLDAVASSNSSETGPHATARQNIPECR